MLLDQDAGDADQGRHDDGVDLEALADFRLLADAQVADDAVEAVVGREKVEGLLLTVEEVDAAQDEVEGSGTRRDFVEALRSAVHVRRGDGEDRKAHDAGKDMSDQVIHLVFLRRARDRDEAADPEHVGEQVNHRKDGHDRNEVVDCGNLGTPGMVIGTGKAADEVAEAVEAVDCKVVAGAEHPGLEWYGLEFLGECFFHFLCP